MRIAAIAAVAAAAGVAAAGPMFRSVSNQGSVHNKTFSAIEYSGTLADGYDYGQYQFGHSNSGVLMQSDLAVDKVNVFLVNGSDGLGVFVVFESGQHDAANLAGENQGGTRANHATGVLSFSPGNGNQSLLLEDDRSDTDMRAGTSVDPFHFDFNWAKGYTDGFVSSFHSLDQAFTLDLASYHGIDGFNLYGAEGLIGSGLFGDIGGLSSDALNDYITINAVPLPGAGVLAGAGLLGLGATRRRR